MTADHGKSSNRVREERLAAALRDNLKRRKAQAKGRAQAAAENRRNSGGTSAQIAAEKPKG
jgi:hypothetical protein